MRIYAGDKNDDTWQYLQLKCNGQDIPFCLWFDTDEGMAECCFAVPSGYRVPDDWAELKYKVLSSQNDYRDTIIHTYTLHNFEVWDKRTDQCVAKV